MIKKIFFIVSVLGAFASCAHGVIIDIQTFTKQMPSGQVQTVYLFGDAHVESPLNQQHLFYILRLARALGTESTAFIIEDAFAQLNRTATVPVPKQIACESYKTSYLNGLSLLSARCNFETTNVEFRAPPAFTVSREITHKRESIARECFQFAQETLKAKLQQLPHYNDSLESNLFYHKAFAAARRELGVLDTILSVKNPMEYFGTRPAIKQLFEAETMHAIHSYANKKNILVCAGAAHTARIAQLLTANHYTACIKAGEPHLGKLILLVHEFELTHDQEYPDTGTHIESIIRMFSPTIDHNGPIQKDIAETLCAITDHAHKQKA